MKNFNKFISEKKIPYQKHLCPDVWTNKKLDKDIETKLLKIEFLIVLNI